MKPYLLVLENFQSIRERTEIPIGSLTFLYGPNSAGKSCIDDAFLLIKSVFSDSKTPPSSMFWRWTRSEFDATNQEEIQNSKMSVELHCHVGKLFTWIGDVAALGQIAFLKNGLVDWFEKNGWNIVLSVQGNRDGLTRLSLSSGSETVFSIQQYEEDEWELDISLRVFGKTFKELTEKHSVNHLKGHKSYEFKCELVVGPPVVSLWKGEDLDREIVAIVNAMLVDLRDIRISPTNLGADRSTIKNSLLSWICQDKHGFWSDLGLPSGYFKAPVFEMNSNGDSNSEFMQKIAVSNFRAAYLEIHPAPEKDKTFIQAAFEAGVAAAGGIPYKNDEMLHEFVNRCLREHLFLDQGYQLIFEALEIKPATDIDVPKLSAALMIGSLVDKSGRRMTFEDVGTGISCVLPVLVAVHSGFGFIQQPELHLHPALQSALGDIFIESINSQSSCHFIETHSEYILLRCLRRIRETSAGKYPSGSALALKPEDLSVLYFEPQPENYTKVKRIRVSTRGDFVDRWPRGFFEERGKELFDE